MNGLELSKRFYQEVGKPMLAEQFPEVLPYLAVGLLGSGSECFGYDDEFSRDHDFEPAFCLFLPEEDVVDRRTAFRLERAYAALPNEFLGFSRQRYSAVGGNRHGVLRLGEFLENKTGRRDGELTLGDWLTLLEGEQPDAVKTALRALLGYGAAAQVYFDYRTDALADAGYAFTREELDAADPGINAGVTAERPSAAFCGATLLLHSRVGIRLYFTENVGGELLYHEQKGLYYSEIAAISANQLGTAQTVTVDGTNYTVSVLSLARQVMDNEHYDPAFRDLMKALTLYANAAAAL